MHRLKLNTTVKTLQACQKPFLHLQTVYSRIAKRRKRSAFQRLRQYREEEESSFEGRDIQKVQSVEIIREEEWGDNMTAEQIEDSCRYYR